MSHKMRLELILSGKKLDSDCSSRELHWRIRKGTLNYNHLPGLMSSFFDGQGPGEEEKRFLPEPRD